MLIKLINPNTTEAMSRMIDEAASLVASPGTRIVTATSRSGAASIEGHYDEAMSILGIVDEIMREPEAEAYVIACFGDPGLLAAREITTAPVLGIAEAAMHAATFVATGFSVVTTLERTRIISEHLVRKYGMEHFCRRVRATDVPVLELERPKIKRQSRHSRRMRTRPSGGQIRSHRARLCRHGRPDQVLGGATTGSGHRWGCRSRKVCGGSGWSWSEDVETR